MPAGRPSLFDERSPKFLEQIENCLPTKAAAALAGIDDNTVMRWLAAGREQKSAKFINFSKCYTRARGIALAKMVERVRVLGREDWRSEFSLLERMFPQDFAKPEVNVAAAVVNNGFVITVEKAQQLERRTQVLEVQAEKLFDTHAGTSNNGP
jgi:hypothetical protein